ncbi:unnamed protein product [Clavelina lepadiformis]|uniref:Uncharacterized protein n=1 Tax=Clavelina lepadiformis TaxID=159417 RepID=A0ABP0FAE5_CLALP
MRCMWSSWSGAGKNKYSKRNLFSKGKMPSNEWLEILYYTHVYDTDKLHSPKNNVAQVCSQQVRIHQWKVCNVGLINLMRSHNLITNWKVFFKFSRNPRNFRPFLKNSRKIIEINSK